MEAWLLWLLVAHPLLLVAGLFSLDAFGLPRRPRAPDAPGLRAGP